MREIASLELHRIVGELKEGIAGSYLRKFYDMDNGEFRLSFYKNSETLNVYVRLTVTVNRTEFAEEQGGASQFAIAMRKRIENAKVADFHQRRSDRIIVMELAGGGERFFLIIEMFGKGNMILCDDKMTTALCYANVTHKDRSIRPKVRYEFPKSDAYELDIVDGSLLETLMKNRIEGEKLIVWLSRYLNIGPMYLEEAIRNAGLDPKETVKREDYSGLIECLLDVIERSDSSKPVMYLKDYKAVDYSLIPVSRYSSLESREFESLSRLLDEFYIGERGKKDEGRENQLKEVEASIAKQRELAERLKQETEAYAKSAEAIYQNINSVSEIIQYIKESKKIDMEMLKQRFGERIKALDQKRKRVTIEV